MLFKITLSTFISGLIDYMFIMIFCLLGSVVKDTYNTLTEKETKVKISRILISTLVSSILLFSISDYLAAKMTWKVFILPCFLCGGLGFEIFGRISKIEFVITLITKNSGKNILENLKELSDNKKESPNDDKKQEE